MLRVTFTVLIAILAIDFFSSTLRAADGATPTAATQNKVWTGTATKTGSGLPLLVSGDVRYRLKPSTGAPEAVVATITAIAKGDREGRTYRVKGMESTDGGKQWISATELTEVVVVPKKP